MYMKLPKSNTIIDRAQDLIPQSCKIKKQIVESDEKEAAERKLLNFGHTAGHALESLSIKSIARFYTVKL